VELPPAGAPPVPIAGAPPVAPVAPSPGVSFEPLQPTAVNTTDTSMKFANWHSALIGRAPRLTGIRSDAVQQSRAGG
jgi:hypothetical protein